MRISGEGRIAIFLALIFAFGAGAAVRYPDQAWIGNCIMAVAAIGLVLVLAHHVWIERKNKPLGISTTIVGTAVVLISTWYCWPAAVNPRLASATMPVIAIDCHSTQIPNIAPINGLNYIDFKYLSPMNGVGNIRGGSMVTLGSTMLSEFCDFTTHSNADLYDIIVNMHVRFNEVLQRTPDGTSIGRGSFVGESDYPIIITTISNTLSFGFYALTTGEYMVNVSLPKTAQYTDGQAGGKQIIRLLMINHQAIDLIPPGAFIPKR